MSKDGDISHDINGDKVKNVLEAVNSDKFTGTLIIRSKTGYITDVVL